MQITTKQNQTNNKWMPPHNKQELLRSYNHTANILLRFSIGIVLLSHKYELRTGFINQDNNEAVLI